MAVGFPTKVDYATGDVLSAGNMNDLSGTVNLLESAQYAAGKNKIINGDFGIWQRGTSFTTNGAYTADRFQMTTTAGQGTVSQQTFTPGTAPVAGYENQYFLRYNATASNADPRIFQPLEDVRTFAGQTVTVSFWAKSATSNALAQIQLAQIFGSGGSANVTVNSSAITLTSSWARYSATLTLASISGKTIGTNSNLRLTFDLENSTAFDFDLWGVQLEAGSTASAFQTATGTKQGELAACQRYYWRASFDAATQRLGSGICLSTTNAFIQIPYPVEMRIRPTALEQSGTAGDYSVAIFGANPVCSAVPTFANATKNGGTVSLDVASGLTNGQAAFFRNVNTAAFFGWSAEL
jgi:hypothetical protein